MSSEFRFFNHFSNLESFFILRKFIEYYFVTFQTGQYGTDDKSHVSFHSCAGISFVTDAK